MELLRTITYQPAAGTKMCEQALGKACGADSKKKRPPPTPEEPQPPQPQAQVQPAAPHHHHHHSHSGTEISRIIVDPTTGKRYCRGKVLGKVKSAGRPAARREGGLPGRPPSRADPESPRARRASVSKGTARHDVGCSPALLGLLCAVTAPDWLYILPPGGSVASRSSKKLILKPETRAFYTRPFSLHLLPREFF